MMRYRALLVAALIVVGAPASPQKFLPDDPVWTDLDQLPIAQPERSAVSKAYDFLENTFAKRGGAELGRAVNINTLGEVPDSSWFTNRIGQREMSLAELARGPRRGTGPDRTGPWVILSLKTEGITPGFTIRDSRGDKYLIKFDPRDYAQMATSAEVISTHFFHAIGYHVPENYVAILEPSRLEVDERAVVVDAEGRARPLTRRHVNARIDAAPVRSDGRIQVLASLYLPGTPIGPFKYFATRGDDPNDIFSHEDRRELRGLRVFAAWLNHNDSDAANTLDVYVREGGRGFVRHYLIDFGTTLGSGGFEPHSKRAGNEHYLEWGPAMKSAVSFGLWDRPWRGVDYPEFPSIGRFESSHFRPQHWRPDYPNPAFERMQPADAFWAASILARFDDERIRAIVRTGEIRDRAAEEHLARALIERRDKILRCYLSASNPIARFSLQDDGTSLRFENLGAHRELGTVTGYRYQWFRYDDENGALAATTEPLFTPELAIPVMLADADYSMVRIHTVSPDEPRWENAVDVYIRNDGAPTIVGIDRNFD